jgi:hypothetical protein
MRFASAVKLASATTTSDAYSTSKSCSMAKHMRLACRSDQKLKSSGSRSSVSWSSGVKDGAFELGVLGILGALQETGIKDGSESRQRGTMCMSDSRTEVKSSPVGLSTKSRAHSAPTNLEQVSKATNQKFRWAHPSSSRYTCRHDDIEPKAPTSISHARGEADAVGFTSYFPTSQGKVFPLKITVPFLESRGDGGRARPKNTSPSHSSSCTGTHMPNEDVFVTNVDLLAPT